MNLWRRKEVERLKALHALDILDTAPEARFDAVCRTAQALFGVPIALMPLVDATRLWFKARCGLDADGTEREGAFCDLTIQARPGRALVIRDLTRDERTAGSPLVLGELGARFYAGVPLALRSGDVVGTLCIIDRVARPDFSDAQVRQLEDLALVVEGQLHLTEARLGSEALLSRRRKADEAVRESEHRFRLLAETTTDIIIWSALDTRRRYVSPAVKAVLGYEPEDLIGTRPLGFVHPDDAETYARVLDDLTNARIDQVVTCQRYRRRDGSWVPMEVSQSLARDPISGEATGYVTSLRDITDRMAVENALRVSEERLALVLHSGSDGFWDADLATGHIQVSDHLYRMLGYGVGEIEPDVGVWGSLVHSDDRAENARLLADHLEGRSESYEAEYRMRCKDGLYRWTLARGRVVARDGKGHPLRMVGTHIDVTRRKQAELQVAHMATHDALTGLPNRTLFWDTLQREVAGTGRYGGRFAVFACDIDRFKAINDTLGHPAGDTLLRTLAGRLTQVVRGGDLVARLGGDEFALIVGVETARDAQRLADRVIEAVGAPVDLDGHPAFVGVSIGIACGSGHAGDADQLYMHADIALYGAKAAGRNTFRFYEPGMDTVLATRTLLESDMRQAVQRGGFVLHYQPSVDLATGTTKGFEALMRWQHPLRGAISPSEFIPVAEETGLIVALGTWALREACREAASWPGETRVAVNISAVQFAQPGLEQGVLAALSASGLAPHRLELEITESVLMGDAEGVSACLHRLRAVGVRVALDDFGTGYSSLSYLRQFPFDKIKIDRSFIAGIGDPDTAAIVRAIVGLGRRLGSAITAEGVETEAQLAAVRAEGCTEVQGFLFSRPLPAAEALSFANGQGGREAA